MKLNRDKNKSIFTLMFSLINTHPGHSLSGFLQKRIFIAGYVFSFNKQGRNFVKNIAMCLK